MYAETDFLLALIKDEDWLSRSAETIYRENKSDLWTSQFTLVELLLVAYREERDTERVVANAAKLVEVRGDVGFSSRVDLKATDGEWPGTVNILIKQSKQWSPNQLGSGHRLVTTY